VAQRVGSGIALLFRDRGTRRGWVVNSTPRPHFTPRGKTRYPFYSILDGPQGRSGRAEKLVPTGFRSRTVQPVVSRYTDWATRPTYIYIYIMYEILLHEELHVLSLCLHPCFSYPDRKSHHFCPIFYYHLWSAPLYLPPNHTPPPPPNPQKSKNLIKNHPRVTAQAGGIIKLN